MQFESAKRQFVCFVCGNVFANYKEMQTHIIDSHEQGREYLVCPLKHCGACVRDMRLHFRNIHPKTKLPSCQLRATIMYDISGPGRRKKLPNFMEGYLLSAKNNGKSMHYRSSWEKQVYECLEKLPDVKFYSVEPFSIPYSHKGKHKRYFPDLKVLFEDGTIEIWEIKPEKQVLNEMNTAKFAAAEVFCQMRGWNFQVITEDRIQQLKKDST